MSKYKKIQQSRIVFTLTLEHKVTEDYDDTDYQGKRIKQQRTYDNLSPNSDFYVKRRNQHDKNEPNGSASYGDVRDFVEHVINKEIADELRELIDIPIKEVNVNRTYEGSLIIVFSVFINAFQFISSISGFRDTVKLIENTVNRHIKKRLDDEFSTRGYFDVNVKSERDNDYGHFFEKHGIFPISFSSQEPRTNRDALFWYLLISNIVLLILVGLLVGKAVLKMYG